MTVISQTVGGALCPEKNRDRGIKPLLPFNSIFGAGVIFFAVALTIPAQAQTELLGRVLDKVVCEGDASQSYALYVPKNYVPQKKWPVIFCFDASARGWMPVERLQVAAEQYGYIVAGSLTSRNGPVAVNNAAIKAMIKDVTAHFSVDPNRVYTTGVSGGARVATAVALSGVAKGVIACAAGFPVLSEGIPLRVPFAIFGTTGTEDFNWAEMIQLDRDLTERKAAHRIVVFEGGHQWASAALMQEAVEWLELQAMRSGTRPKDNGFVEGQFKSRLAAVPSQTGWDRWRALRSLVADFSGLVDVVGYEQEAKELGASREVKEALRAEQALMTREAELVEQLGDVALGSRVRKQKLAADLRRQAEGTEDSGERRMVRRAISGYLSMTKVNVRLMFDDKDYGRAVGYLELAAALRAGQKSTWFDLARAHAMDGDKTRAFDALEQAIAEGFDEADRLEVEPAFAKLRREARYCAALSKLRTDASVPALVLPTMRISASLANVELRLYYLPSTGGGTPRLAFLGVETVRPNTLAAQAGIKEGMEVTAIQGVRIRGLTDSELAKMMRLPVTGEIIITVRESQNADERELHLPVVKPAPVKVNSVETLVRTKANQRAGVSRERGEGKSMRPIDPTIRKI